MSGRWLGERLSRASWDWCWPLQSQFSTVIWRSNRWCVLSAYQNGAGSAFNYDPYWDLLSFIDTLFGPPKMYPSWEAFGVTGLTDESMIKRTDSYLVSLLQRYCKVYRLAKQPILHVKPAYGIARDFLTLLKTVLNIIYILWDPWLCCIYDCHSGFDQFD